MKKIFFAIAVLLTVSVISSCSKKNTNDPLIEAGPDVAHPDSTVITVNVPTTTTGVVKMVGDMKGDWPTGWNPGDNAEASSLKFTQVSSGVYSRQVAISWFVKTKFEFKFVNGDDWNKEEVTATGGGVANRAGDRGVMKGKKVSFTVAKFK
jgi:hypothetical protein